MPLYPSIARCFVPRVAGKFCPHILLSRASTRWHTNHAQGPVAVRYSPQKFLLPTTVKQLRWNLHRLSSPQSCASEPSLVDPLRNTGGNEYGQGFSIFFEVAVLNFRPLLVETDVAVKPNPCQLREPPRTTVNLFWEETAPHHRPCLGILSVIPSIHQNHGGIWPSAYSHETILSME